MLKQIKNWLKNREIAAKEKEELIEMIDNQQKIIDTNISILVNRIEELEQNKLYYIYSDCKDENILLKNIFQIAKQNLKWTIPNIIIISKPIEQLTKQELELYLNNLKLLERDGGIKSEKRNL